MRDPAGRARNATGVRVLVVDDDDAVADCCVRILRRFGFEAVAESNLADAWAAVVQKPSLLLADVDLGDASGPMLAARIRMACPEVKVLFMSGGDHPHVAPLLQKPFTPDELIEAVRGVIDEDGAPPPVP